MSDYDPTPLYMEYVSSLLFYVQEQPGVCKGSVRVSYDFSEGYLEVKVTFEFNETNKEEHSFEAYLFPLQGNNGITVYKPYTTNEYPVDNPRFTFLPIELSSAEIFNLAKENLIGDFIFKDFELGEEPPPAVH